MAPVRPGEDSDAESEPRLEVRLQLATHPVLATPLERTLRLRRTATILDLKHRIRQQWDGTPLEEGVTVTKGARVLRDQESLETAFEEELAASTTPPLVLNVIVRPSAWSTPFTSVAPTPRSASPDLFHDAPLPRDPTPPPRTAPDSPAPSSAAADAGSPARSVGSAYTPGFFDAAAAAASSPSPPARPAPSAPALVSPTPSGSAIRAAATTTSTGAAGPYVAYLSHLQRLVPLQRALLLLNLQKAHAHYARIVATGDGDALAEVEALLRGVGLWDSVEERVKTAEAEAGTPALEEEFRVVQIGALPYLLHTPPALLARAPSYPAPSLIRARAIHAHLTTMLQLLVTLAPAAPSIAHGRTVTGRPTPAAVVAAQQVLARAGAAPVAHGPHQADGLGAPQQGLPQQGPQRRRATLSVIINLEAVFALFVPLVLLSVKLGFLLWLFGRNASPGKRLALGVMAVLWVALEGWGILRRRQAQGRDRDRLERERRRAVRAQGRAQQGAGAAAGLGPAQQAVPAGAQAGAGPDAAGRPGAAPAAARTTRRRVPASRLSPKYWLNTLAAVGLVAEARELGLQPRYIAGRPVAPPSPTPPGPVRRALRNVLVATVLFFATLSPEVERKRRRALDKRERLLAERRARDGRDRVAHAQQRLRVQQGALHRAPSGVEVALTSDDDESRQASRAGTPAPGARAHPLRHEVGPAAAAAEREHEGAGEGEGAGGGEGEGEASSTGERLEMDAAGLRRRRMAALAQREQAAGRARIPDAELFRDGGSEAYSSAARTGAPDPSGASGSSSGSAHLGERVPRAILPPPVAAAPQLPALAPVAPAPAAAVAQVDDEREVDPEEEDVASASGDGASTSGDEAGVAGGEQGRAAGAQADEVDEVVALF